MSETVVSNNPNEFTFDSQAANAPIKLSDLITIFSPVRSRNEGVETAKLNDVNLEIIEKCKTDLLLHICNARNEVTTMAGVQAIINFVDGLGFDAADEFAEFFPAPTEQQAALAKKAYDLLLKTDIVDIKRWGMVVYTTMYDTLITYIGTWAYHEKKRLVFVKRANAKQRYKLSNKQTALMGGRKFPLGITEDGMKKIRDTINILQSSIIRPIWRPQ